jgi:hypothetical protein
MLVETETSTSRHSHKSALITPLRRLLGVTGPHPPWDDSAPIRAELFSVERLGEHARSLAAAQGVMAGERKGASLAKRLAENEAVLLSAYRDIAKAVDAGTVITPAAEWLIDNFHVVEKQVREIRADLRRSSRRKYLRINRPLCASNGPSQLRHVIWRQSVEGAARTWTTMYDASQFGQVNGLTGDFGICRPPSDYPHAQIAVLSSGRS